MNTDALTAEDGWTERTTDSAEDDPGRAWKTRGPWPGTGYVAAHPPHKPREVTR